MLITQFIITAILYWYITNHDHTCISTCCIGILFNAEQLFSYKSAVLGYCYSKSC